MVYMGYIIVSSISAGSHCGLFYPADEQLYGMPKKRWRRKKACIQAVKNVVYFHFYLRNYYDSGRYIIHFISNTAAIGDLGHLIGRGALFSVILVLTVLPSLLVLFDSIITRKEWERIRKKFMGKRRSLTDRKMEGMEAKSNEN